MENQNAVSAIDILELVRPLVLVVDGSGQICQAHGAFGGLLGYTLEELVGKSVLEIVGSRDRLEVHGYFGSEAKQPFDPQPFSYIGQIVAADGTEHSVSVYVGGKLDPNGQPLWVVTLVPSDIEASSSDTLNAEISGAPRTIVRQRLADELCRKDTIRPSGSFFVDLVSQHTPIVASCSTLQEFGSIAAQAVGSGWHPWEESSAQDGFFIYANDRVPWVLRGALEAKGWRVGGVAKVSIDNTLVGAFLFVVDPSTTSAELKGSTNLHGRVSNLVKVAALVLQRWLEHDKLALAASTDYLTGLSNRTVLDTHFDSSSNQTSLLYIDVDHFKAINDTWGHQAGDKVLVAIARRLEQICRPGDTIVRLGGDEFVVVLPNVDSCTAKQVGQRILEEMSAPLELDEGPEKVSVSIGLSSTNSLRLAKDMTALLADADSNLLRAKRGGRERLESAG